MQLTVIMPFYNRAKYIEKALLSLLRQRATCALDILVVNDGSTDEGPNIVAALSARYPQIRMVTTQNQGVTKARNVGLAHIQPDCEFVTFLDSDDISPEDRIASDLARFVDSPDIQLTYGRMTYVDEIDEATDAPAATATQVTVRSISLSAAIFRSAFLRGIGTFDESFEQAEDADLLFRAFETGGPYLLTDTICVYYRQHDSNMTRNVPGLRRSLMRALHRSVVRRRQDPLRSLPEDWFEMMPLTEWKAA